MRKRYLITSVIFLLLLNIPYLLAITTTNPGYVFGGFLFNPLDGNSYLAKMYQGWQGDWAFTLPYSAETNQDAALFLFYLFLGHVARWFGLSNLLVFHLARILSSVFLLTGIHYFFSTLFMERLKVAWWAYLYSILGLGCGWLAVIFGGFTADFWVAEAFPILSMYSSPHFTLGLAILVWLLTESIKTLELRKIPLLMIGGMALGIVFPFGVVVATVVTAGNALLDLLGRLKINWRPAFAFLLPGGLVILYQFIVIRTDPILALWDQQNQTVSPPLWNLLISFSPLLLLAFFGLAWSIKRRDRKVGMLAGWLLLGLALFYVPFNLQRRFMFGYMIPVAGLAAYGLAELKTRGRTWIGIGTLMLSLPTLFVVIIGGVQAVKNNDSKLVIEKSEIQAFTYLAQNSDSGDLILAAPDTGMFIPAYTGLRVIYGHPFETINADHEIAAVENFYSQPVTAETIAWARERGVRWILWGPRESLYGPAPSDLFAGMLLEFQDENLKLYRLQANP